METSLYKRISQRQSQLEDLRRYREDKWKIVLKYFQPWYQDWDDDTDNDSTQGSRVYTGVPTEALTNWADGMRGHLVSSAFDWFRFSAEFDDLDEIKTVRKWFEVLEEFAISIYNNSNFYSSLGPAFMDGGSIGDTVLFMPKNEERDTIDFQSFHPKEVYHDRDVVHRYFKLTAKEAAEKFGKDKLSNAIKNNLKTNPFAKHKFIHAIYKKSDLIFDKIKDIPDRDWIAVYIEVASGVDEPLRISGYNSKPYAHWPYMDIPQSHYGWGNGCTALYGVESLNQCTKDNIIAQNIRATGTYKASMSMRGRVNIRPGGISYMKSDEMLEAMNNNLDIGAGVDREERLALNIDKIFNVDFFLMLSRAEKPMTATEILEKTGERSILLSPKVGQLESKFLNGIHERVINFGLENRMVPPPPDILMDTGGNIKFEYLGPLAQAQKQARASKKYQQALGYLMPLMQIKPDIVDNFDFDKTARRMMREEYWPIEDFIDEQQVQEMRQQRAQAMQAQAEMQMLSEAADKVPKLQKATEAGSPLEALTS